MTENVEYKSDPEFDIMIQPYSDEELKAITDKLKNGDILRVVHLWQGSIVMNTAMYKMLEKMKLSYITKNHNYAWKEQAALSICLRQAKREDLTPTYKKFLIGKEFFYRNLAQKNSFDENSNTKCRLSTTIGNKYDITGCSVTRYCTFADAITNIYLKDEAMALLILMDKCRISHDNVIEISRLKTDEVHAVYKALMKKDDEVPKVTLSFIRSEVKQRYVTKVKRPMEYEQDRINKEKPPAIRQMPAYDPDSEVNSLCMTIGYWITSMQRVNNKENLRRITTKARIQLMKELSFLESTIGNLQETLVEERTDA